MDFQKSVSLLITLLLLATGCATQSKYSVETPFLYQVTKGEQKGYLFGTIHIGVTDEDLPADFWSYFYDSDVYAFEDNLTEEKFDLSAHHDLLFHENPNQELQKLLSAKNYVKLQKVFSEFNPRAAEQMAKHLTPLGALLVLESQNELRKNATSNTRLERGEIIRLKEQFVLDRKLLERAQRTTHPVTYLDAQSRRLILQCKYGNQAEQLSQISEILNSPEISQDKLSLYRQAVQIYRKGDAKELLDFVAEEENRDSCLLGERNLRWLRPILGMFQAYESPFIAVGVAHIEGRKDSLIQLLKERGFQVQRMNFK